MLGYVPLGGPTPYSYSGPTYSTLAGLRAQLNAMVGVVTDGETSPWPVAQRNAAINAGLADLWREGVWKDALQDLTSASNTWTYALTSIRHLTRLELLDSSGAILEQPKGIIEPDGTGTAAFQLRLRNPIDTGYTIRVRGWAPYLSSLGAETDGSDVPTEYERIPLLKAQAILYRTALANFARWGESQVLVPAMNVSVDALMALVAASEREYAELCRTYRAQRTRVSVNGRL